MAFISAALPLSFRRPFFAALYAAHYISAETRQRGGGNRAVPVMGLFQVAAGGRQGSSSEGDH